MADGPDEGTRAQEQMFEQICAYWDADAATYDFAPAHRPTSAAVIAAWTGVLKRLLPKSPARVLDVGAGTGFLALIAAQLGHTVTALDLSAQMLDRLQDSARDDGVEIRTLRGRADETPTGFDVVMERHLLWTLPDPDRALRAWRRSAPAGRLVLFESVWGDVDPVESLRARTRHTISRLRGTPPEHHGEYPDNVRRSVPFGHGTPPANLIAAVVGAEWRSPRLERLRDVEWAERSELPLLDRLVGVAPRFAIVAE